MPVGHDAAAADAAAAAVAVELCLKEEKQAVGYSPALAYMLPTSR